MLPDEEHQGGAASAPGTPPPQSPAPASNGHRRMSTGKEEGVWYIAWAVLWMLSLSKA